MRALTVLTVLIACGLLTACSKDHSRDLKNYVAKLEQKPAGKVKPFVMPKPVKTYSLPSTDLRDPFSPLATAQDIAKRPDATRPRQALERYSLDALKMVGTVTTGKVIWALVQSPLGLNRVKVGDYIGLNSGKIISISNTALTLQETVPGINTQWQQRTVTLDLS